MPVDKTLSDQSRSRKNPPAPAAPTATMASAEPPTTSLVSSVALVDAKTLTARVTAATHSHARGNEKEVGDEGMTAESEASETNAAQSETRVSSATKQDTQLATAGSCRA